MAKKDDNKIDFEKISFSIIVKVAEAKDKALTALQEIRKGKQKEFDKLIGESRAKIGEAGHEHLEVISKEAAGEDVKYSVLFMHAEDQLLTTQTLIDLVVEMATTIKDVNKLKEKCK